MSNPLTITNATLINSAGYRQIYVTVLAPSSPTQATNTIIYDPTGTNYTGTYVATKIRSCFITSSVQGSSGTLGGSYLTWDASTPVAAISIPNNSDFTYPINERSTPPLPNQGGSGVTGKIGLTTNGLVAGDTITIVLDIING